VVISGASKDTKQNPSFKGENKMENDTCLVCKAEVYDGDLFCSDECSDHYFNRGEPLNFDEFQEAFDDTLDVYRNEY
jgi:hypothetical protein